MDVLTYLIQLFFILQVVLFKQTKCVNLQYENDGIKQMIEKLIDERQQQLEDKLRKEFEKKIKTVMEEQYREKEKVRHLEETLNRQQREILLIRQSEEMARQEIIALKQNVNDLKSKCQRTHSDLLVSEELSPTFYGIPSSKDVPMERKRRYSRIRPATLAEEESRAIRLLLGTVQPDDTPVAFYAYMRNNTVNPGTRHTLIFDQVETNIGNGYHSHIGVFIAPRSGIYMFAYTTYLEPSSYFSVEIVVNSVIRGAAYVQNPASPTVFTGSTGIAVLFLNQGDECYIRTHDTPYLSGTIRSDDLMRTTFSGVKI